MVNGKSTISDEKKVRSKNNIYENFKFAEYFKEDGKDLEKIIISIFKLWYEFCNLETQTKERKQNQ